MEKSDQKASVIMCVLLGFVLVLTVAFLVLLILGPVRKQAAEIVEEETVSTEETALAKSEQKQVMFYDMKDISYRIVRDGFSTDQGNDSSPAGPPEGKVVLGNGDYILPESNSRFYTEEELKGLDDKQLSLARNEIYARLGRKFNSEELTQYFSQKLWYKPVYEPSAFDGLGDTVFNQYELSNRNLILKIEDERKGG